MQFSVAKKYDNCYYYVCFRLSIAQGLYKHKQNHNCSQKISCSGENLKCDFFPEEYYCLWSVIWNQNLFQLENTIDLP